MNKFLYTGILGCFFLTGCASIVSSTEQTVTINSNMPSTNLQVKNRSGLLIYDGQAPATLSLKKKKGYFSGEKYTITAQKQGYPSQMMTIDTGINGWYWGNIIFGGLIGLLIVDPATGAMWDFPSESVMINIPRGNEIEKPLPVKKEEERETLF